MLGELILSFFLAITMTHIYTQTTNYQKAFLNTAEQISTKKRFIYLTHHCLQKKLKKCQKKENTLSYCCGSQVYWFENQKLKNICKKMNRYKIMPRRWYLIRGNCHFSIGKKMFSIFPAELLLKR